MSAHIDLGVTGAKRQTWQRANPRDVLRRIIDSHPELSEEEICEACWSAMRRNQRQLRSIFEYWFTNNYRSLVRRAPAAAASAASAEVLESEARDSGSTTLPLDDETARFETPALVSSLRARIVAHIEERIGIALLSMILPSGKELRHAPREELIATGGWLRSVAVRLLPGQTVAEAGLLEHDLRELYSQASD